MFSLSRFHFVYKNFLFVVCHWLIIASALSYFADAVVISCDRIDGEVYYPSPEGSTTMVAVTQYIWVSKIWADRCHLIIQNAIFQNNAFIRFEQNWDGQGDAGLDGRGGKITIRNIEADSSSPDTQYFIWTSAMKNFALFLVDGVTHNFWNINVNAEEHIVVYHDKDLSNIKNVTVRNIKVKASVAESTPEDEAGRGYFFWVTLHRGAFYNVGDNDYELSNVLVEVDGREHNRKGWFSGFDVMWPLSCRDFVLRNITITAFGPVRNSFIVGFRQAVALSGRFVGEDLHYKLAMGAHSGIVVVRGISWIEAPDPSSMKGGMTVKNLLMEVTGSFPLAENPARAGHPVIIIGVDIGTVLQSSPFILIENITTTFGRDGLILRSSTDNTTGPVWLWSVVFRDQMTLDTSIKNITIRNIRLGGNSPLVPVSQQLQRMASYSAKVPQNFFDDTRSSEQSFISADAGFNPVSAVTLHACFLRRTALFVENVSMNLVVAQEYKAEATHGSGTIAKTLPIRAVHVVGRNSNEAECTPKSISIENVFVNTSVVAAVPNIEISGVLIENLYTQKQEMPAGILGVDYVSIKNVFVQVGDAHRTWNPPGMKQATKNPPTIVRGVGFTSVANVSGVSDFLAIDNVGVNVANFNIAIPDSISSVNVFVVSFETRAPSTIDDDSFVGNIRTLSIKNLHCFAKSSSVVASDGTSFSTSSAFASPPKFASVFFSAPRLHNITNLVITNIHHFAVDVSRAVFGSNVTIAALLLLDADVDAEAGAVGSFVFSNFPLSPMLIKVAPTSIATHATEVSAVRFSKRAVVRESSFSDGVLSIADVKLAVEVGADSAANNYVMIAPPPASASTAATLRVSGVLFDRRSWSNLSSVSSSSLRVTLALSNFEINLTWSSTSSSSSSITNATSQSVSIFSMRNLDDGTASLLPSSPTATTTIITPSSPFEATISLQINSSRINVIVAFDDDGHGRSNAAATAAVTATIASIDEWMLDSQSPSSTFTLRTSHSSVNISPALPASTSISPSITTNITNAIVASSQVYFGRLSLGTALALVEFDIADAFVACTHVCSMLLLGKDANLLKVSKGRVRISSTGSNALWKKYNSNNSSSSSSSLVPVMATVIGVTSPSSSLSLDSNFSSTIRLAISLARHDASELSMRQSASTVNPLFSPVMLLPSSLLFEGRENAASSATTNFADFKQSFVSAYRSVPTATSSVDPLLQWVVCDVRGENGGKSYYSSQVERNILSPLSDEYEPSSQSNRQIISLEDFPCKDNTTPTETESRFTFTAPTSTASHSRSRSDSVTSDDSSTPSESFTNDRSRSSSQSFSPPSESSSSSLSPRLTSTRTNQLPKRSSLKDLIASETTRAVTGALQMLSGSSMASSGRKISAVSALADCGTIGSASSSGWDETSDDFPPLEWDANPFLIEVGETRFFSTYRGTILSAPLFLLAWNGFVAVVAIVKAKGGVYMLCVKLFDRQTTERCSNNHRRPPSKLLASSITCAGSKKSDKAMRSGEIRKREHCAEVKTTMSISRSFRVHHLPGSCAPAAFSLLPAASGAVASMLVLYGSPFLDKVPGYSAAVDMVIIVLGIVTSMLLPTIVFTWVAYRVDTTEVLKSRRLTMQLIREAIDEEKAETKKVVHLDDGELSLSSSSSSSSDFDEGDGDDDKKRASRQEEGSASLSQLPDPLCSASSLSSKGASCYTSFLVVSRYFLEPAQEYKGTRFVHQWGPAFDGFKNGVFSGRVARQRSQTASFVSRLLVPRYFLIVEFVFVTCMSIVEGIASTCPGGGAQSAEACCEGSMVAMMALVAVETSYVVLLRPFLVRVEVVLCTAISIINAVVSILIFMSFTRADRQTGFVDDDGVALPPTDMDDVIANFAIVGFYLGLLGGALGCFCELVPFLVDGTLWSSSVVRRHSCCHGAGDDEEASKDRPLLTEDTSTKKNNHNQDGNEKNVVVVKKKSSRQTNLFDVEETQFELALRDANPNESDDEKESRRLLFYDELLNLAKMQKSTPKPEKQGERSQQKSNKPKHERKKSEKGMKKGW